MKTVQSRLMNAHLKTIEGRTWSQNRIDGLWNEPCRVNDWSHRQSFFIGERNLRGRTVAPALQAGFFESRSPQGWYPASKCRKERKGKWAAEIAHGLLELHEAGLVHRDLICENVVFDGNDDAYITYRYRQRKWVDAWLGTSPGPSEGSSLRCLQSGARGFGNDPWRRRSTTYRGDTSHRAQRTIVW